METEKVDCVYCLRTLETDFDEDKQAHFDCFKAIFNYQPDHALKDQIELILEHVEKIPEKYWQELEFHRAKKVIWFLDRQRPNVEAYYTFDEERFGVTKDRKIVWGFDSGCSCPAPWGEDDCYHIVKEWKEFIINEVPHNSAGDRNFDTGWFDIDWEEESMNNLAVILAEIGVLE